MTIQVQDSTLLRILIGETILKVTAKLELQRDLTFSKVRPRLLDRNPAPATTWSRVTLLARTWKVRPRWAVNTVQRKIVIQALVSTLLSLLNQLSVMVKSARPKGKTCGEPTRKPRSLCPVQGSILNHTPHLVLQKVVQPTLESAERTSAMIIPVLASITLQIATCKRLRVHQSELD